MMKDMLTRFTEMKQDAKERGFRVTDVVLSRLVLADVIEDRGIDIERKLGDIAKSLIVSRNR
jgi:hypothetical protein